MTFSLSTQGLALASARRPWRTVGAWVAVLVLAIVVIAAFLESALTTDDYFTNNPESVRARELLRDREFDFGNNASEIVIVRSETFTVEDDEYREFVEGLFVDLNGLFDDVTGLEGSVIFNYYETGDDSLVSEDRRTTLIPFALVADIDRLQDMVAQADGARAFQVLVTGSEFFAGVPAEVLTAGETAHNVDFFDVAKTYLPIVVGFVLAVSFVLLTVIFRSLVVPIKAMIMNLLSVGAAYGLMVLVFQHGFAADLLGFQKADSIAAWVPLYLFAVLFGLSMDYHVILLSRIQERFGQTGDNTEAVAYGLRSTGGLITGAALIMIAVFAGFAMGQLVMFQQMGFGLAVAVFLDATIVRSVLVPASMKLLGTRNWWLPSALSWLPEISMETGERPQPAESAASDD